MLHSSTNNNLVNKILIILPILFSLALFAKSISYYFFQDDFYEILISKATNWNEFLNLFTFIQNRSSYRPIGLQLYFFLSQTLFGLNPGLYHLVTFALFFSTYLLIINVISKITSRTSIGILAATFWVTASFHFMSLSWLAASWLIIGNFFFFLTSYLFLKYFKTKKSHMYFLALACFLLTLGSYEFFIVWPAIFLLVLVLWYQKKVKDTLKLLAPFFAISFLYVFARLRFASLPQIDEYQISFGSQTVKQIFWYLLWSFNIPEEFKKQIVSNLVIFNFQFFSEYKNLVLTSFVSAIAIVLLGIVLPLHKAIKAEKVKTYSILIISTAWFIFGILPVAVFPNHSFAMYLVLAPIGIYMLIAYLTIKYSNRYVLWIILIIWCISTFTATRFNRNNLWIVESQRFSKEVSLNVKNRYPTLPDDAIVLIPLKDKRHIQALLNDNAIKVIYQNKSIKTYFDENTLIDDLNNKKVYGEVFKYISD